MITKDQIKILAKQYQIDEYSIFREYMQLIFLSYLYQEKSSNNFIFKGGTALRLLFNSPRFSEDLDFSTSLSDTKIVIFLKKIIKKISKEFPSLKLKPLYSGKEGIRFRIVIKNPEFKYPFAIRLDFHRQKTIKDIETSVLTTNFPIMIFPQIFHLSKIGILKEKINALSSRKKGRDIFDIWFLLSKGIHIKNMNNKIIKLLRSFPQKTTEKDLSKFLPNIQRQIIPILKEEITKLIPS